MSKRIGITGNIGSGKTTVARLFEHLGIPVYYADTAAKQLMHTSLELRQAITDRFGSAAYAFPDGQAATAPDELPPLNRAYLAETVFGNPAALADLNAIVHPAVGADALRWHQQQTTPYTLYEAAITFETGGYKSLDAVIVVTAPRSLRLARVMQRDGSSQEQVEARMDRQWPEEKKVALADYLVHNHGHRLLMPQVLRIHRAICEA